MRHQRGVDVNANNAIPCKDAVVNTRIFLSCTIAHQALGTSSPVTRISYYLPVSLHDVKSLNVRLQDMALPGQTFMSAQLITATVILIVAFGNVGGN